MLITEVKRAIENLVIDSADVPFRLVRSSDFSFVLEDDDGNQLQVSMGRPPAAPE